MFTSCLAEEEFCTETRSRNKGGVVLTERRHSLQVIESTFDKMLVH